MGAGKKTRSKTPRFAVLRFLAHPAGKVAVAAVAVAVTIGVIAVSYFYAHFGRIADQKLASGPIGNTAMLFAAPERVRVGDAATAEEIVRQLQRSGYSDSRKNRIGWYNVRPDGVEIFPARESSIPGEDAVILIGGGKVERIISLRDNTERTLYDLEPELVTNLFSHEREKRRLVRFSDLPKHLVDAILAAEDKRFFQHAGFDPVRVLKSAYINMKTGRINQGASTLTMQLAGDIWLDRSERTWRRKFAEVFITLHLEQKLTKEQIFEYYANQIYLGNIGSFAIHGYGEGAQAYFNKDVRHLELHEAALLAGLPNAPNRYNPFRHPDRVKARRDWVLEQMLEAGMVSEREYAVAVESPLGVVHGAMEAGDAPYFVDLVNQWLREQFAGHDFQSQSYRVYTTLDANLQREAVEAVRIGLGEVDKRCLELGRTPEKGWPPMQVALVALDPHTGAVKAVVGGRSYAQSQLNRALAKRPPGSVFKPFVYAAALNTAVEGGLRVLTNQTLIDDEPTTFWYDDKPYEPSAYKDRYYGQVTLRLALSKSLNVPTVKVAEMVGYDRVVEMAQRAGLNMSIQPTPAVALGSYEVTPLEIAGAYTMFANQGQVLKPNLIQRIRDQEGKVLYQHQPDVRTALDPRVAYLMVSVMEETLRSGTGVRTRYMGFTLPAAGKTGTSHDGWFAGFTSELLCVVWVGYDDYRDIKMEGAQTALPIWTEFMKRAHTHRTYRRAKAFAIPDGVITVDIDPLTGKLAAPGCGADPVTEVYVAGTQPVELCNGSLTQVAGWELTGDEPPAPDRAGRRAAASSSDPRPPREVVMEKEPEPKKKKGVLGRILSVFK